MKRMIAEMTEHPVATRAGAYGMLCLVVYPLFKARPLLLTIYLRNNIGFVAHYGLLSQATAMMMMMDLLIGVRTLVAIGLARWPSLRWACYALVPLFVGVAVVPWHHAVSLLPAAATALSTLGHLRGHETASRSLMLVSELPWTANDLLMASLPGLLADISCVAGGWMLFKDAQSR
jgi:hypothetical protein